MRNMNFNMDIIMNRKFILGAATAVLLLSASSVSSKPVTKTNWLQTFTVSTKGGHIIGNPAAPTKVVEYASYTCSHCAAFEANDVPLLKSQYISSGKVSFEIRNLARDPIDLTVAVLARCGGKGKFFGNHKMLMANQSGILSKANTISDATNEKLKVQDFTGFMIGAYTELGLVKYMAARGITDAQAKTCLSDKSAFDAVIAMTNEATGPLKMQGTPTFMVNDKIASEVHNLASLKPLLVSK